jgi:hypothetical protein
MVTYARTAGLLLISDASVKIIVALIGAAAGIAGTWLAFVLPERKKRSTLVADFLQTLGESVTQMIAMFEKQEIPHQAGHELYTEIAYFEKATHRRMVSIMALETLDKLKALSQDAVVVDVVLYKSANSKALREAWVMKAKGIVGELRGEAAKLRAS